MSTQLHENEFTLSTEFVCRLVHTAFPQYKALPITRLGQTGSSNVLFRLGDALLVRLPRQPGGGLTIEKEYRWSGEIGAALPVATPEIVELGEPLFDYTEHWSIVRWIDGATPQIGYDGGAKPTAQSRLATELADVVKALRATELSSEAINDANLRCYRGRPLIEFDQLTRQNIQKCRSIDGLNLNLDAVLSVWSDAMALPESHKACEDRWYHGDLVAENILLADGKLCAILDFGGLGIGDATVDLHGVWELLDSTGRDAFRAHLNVDDSEWLRAQAWALGISLNAIMYYWTTMPGRMQSRLKMIESVLDDVSG